MEGAPHIPLQVFVSYAHEDADLMQRLRDHLAVLRQQNIIADWYDGEIVPGQEWADAILEHLESSSLILLLISSSFLASDFIASVELKRALERHEAREATVIPILLRDVEWQESAIGHLQVLPERGRPVELWAHRNEAFKNIAAGIRRAIGAGAAPRPPERLATVEAQAPAGEPYQGAPDGEQTSPPRTEKTNTRARASAPKRVTVRLRLLTELDESQSELEAFVRLYMELESVDRSAKARELSERVRFERPQGPDLGFWRDAEHRLGELKPIRGVQIPGSEFEEIMERFNEQLDEAKLLITSITDSMRTANADPDEVTRDLLSALNELYSASEALLDMCRTSAEGCLRDIGSQLKLILHGVPQLTDAEDVRTQPQEQQEESAAAIVRQRRPSERTSSPYATTESTGRLTERGRQSR